MNRADLELVFTLLIVGYYLYSFFTKGKEQQKKGEVPEPAQPTQKRKTLFEEFLEEWEKQQKGSQPTTSTPPLEPVLPKDIPVDRPRKKQKSHSKQINQPAAIHIPEEGGYTTFQPAADPSEKQEILKKKKPPKIRLGNTVLSPMDAMVAQIVFERKF